MRSISSSCVALYWSVAPILHFLSSSDLHESHLWAVWNQFRTRRWTCFVSSSQNSPWGFITHKSGRYTVRVEVENMLSSFLVHYLVQRTNYFVIVFVVSINDKKSDLFVGAEWHSAQHCMNAARWVGIRCGRGWLHPVYVSTYCCYFLVC